MEGLLGECVEDFTPTRSAAMVEYGKGWREVVLSVLQQSAPLAVCPPTPAQHQLLMPQLLTSVNASNWPFGMNQLFVPDVVVFGRGLAVGNLTLVAER